MAGRSNTELKVFLNGSLTDYQTFCQNPNDPNAKLGSVFFDKTNHTIYVEGNKVVGTQVENVVWDNDDKILTIYPISGAPINVELGVDDALTNLESTLKAWANTEFEAKDATILRQGNVVDNVTTTSTIAPLSANQGKVLKGLIDTNTTKLADIEDGAQVNKISSFKANNTEVGGTGNKVEVSLAGNLVDSTNAATGSVKFNLSHKYVAADKKIYFFNSATAPTTGTDGNIFFIDTTDFVKDGILSNAEYNEITHILTLTFNSDAGKEPIPIDLSDLVNVYKASNGITLDGDTFKLSLGDGVKVDGGSLTLSFGDGLKMDSSGKLALDTTKVGVTGINNQGGGEYTINSGSLEVGDNSNVLKPISVVTNGKTIKIEANPKHIFAQFFHENNADATSGIRAKGVKITEDADSNPYSMLMDFTPKVWKFEN